MSYFFRKFVSICSYSSSEIIPCFKRFLAVVIVPMYIFSFWICYLVMTATSESVLDIAGMTAVFSVLIPICTKRLFTMGAYKLIIGFTIHLIKVAVPPSISALIRAELLLFPSSRLHHLFATPKAMMYFSVNGCRVCYHSSKSVPSTICLYGIFT